MIFERIKKADLVKRTITFAHNAEIVKALQNAGEEFSVGADGLVHLAIDDNVVLEKAASGLYRAIMLKGGMATLVDNPTAPTSFRMTKRDAGGNSFTAAHRALEPHRTGPGIPMAKGIQASPIASRAVRNAKLKSALAKAAAGAPYANPDAAKLALMKALVSVGLENLLEEL
jgi:hypothetical protein